MLRGLPFYPFLTEEEKALLLSSIRTVSKKRGELIHSHNEECLGLFTVVSGTVSASVLSDDGREVALFLLHAGDTCILSAACILKSFTSDAHFLAESDATIQILPAPLLHRVMHENLRVECEVYKMANRLIGDVMATMQRMLFTSISSRLAGFLLSESERLGKDGLRLTHEQLAKYIGTAREVVTHAARRLAKAGVISVHYGTITILDRSALEREADKK